MKIIIICRFLCCLGKSETHMNIVIEDIYVDITKNITYLVFPPPLMKYEFQFLIEYTVIIPRWAIPNTDNYIFLKCKLSLLIAMTIDSISLLLIVKLGLFK